MKNKDGMYRGVEIDTSFESLVDKFTKLPESDEFLDAFLFTNNLKMDASIKIQYIKEKRKWNNPSRGRPKKFSIHLETEENTVSGFFFRLI